MEAPLDRDELIARGDASVAPHRPGVSGEDGE
jgi:hypothetical protein